jgi:maleate isomerase
LISQRSVHARRVVVGVVTPHVSPGPEVELPEMTHGRVAVLVGRTAVAQQDGPLTLGDAASAELVAEAAASLAAREVAAVAHASTTTGYLVGIHAESLLVDAMAQACGVPTMSGGLAAVQALRACGAERVIAVHPPWFPRQMDALGATYFREQGIDARVVRPHDLPTDPAAVRTSEVARSVLPLLDAEADAVFVAGTGFRSAGAIDEIERVSGLTVVQANQALLWWAMRATGTARDIRGFGRLLEHIEKGAR